MLTNNIDDNDYGGADPEDTGISGTPTGNVAPIVGKTQPPTLPSPQYAPREVDAIVLADSDTLDVLSEVAVKDINKAFGKHGRKLCSLLKYQRPSKGVNQTGLIGAICNTIKDAKFEFKQDGYGNVYALLLPLNTTKITTCFTAHTDTVHLNDETQEIALNVKDRTLFKVDQAPLGADDGTGVYILLQMIKAAVPGLYCFFKDEESGCIGSGNFLKTHLQFMKDTGITKVISFDRKGTGDVITRQRGDTCASDAFAREVSDALNAHGLKYAPSPNGVYTDSATFMHDIPECTNLSVGYNMQHGPRETQSLEHLDALIDAVTKVNWEAIGAYRVPSPKPPPYVAPKHSQTQSGSTSGNGKRRSWADLDDLDRMVRPDEDAIDIYKIVTEKPWLLSIWLSQEYTAKLIRDGMQEIFTK